MRRSITAACLALASAGAGLLGGCANAQHGIAQFTVQDAQTAKAIATAGGDERGAACWDKLLPVAQILSQEPAALRDQGPHGWAVTRAWPAGADLIPQPAIGLAAAAELKRTIIIAAEGPCAPIILPILVRLGPVLGAADGFLGLGSIP
ncbi:MAG TPA: hypothetical protein VJ770_21260 [Stellaceae bacterium]|nr:hypothetical protein [Stellaceae bacterium]